MKEYEQQLNTQRREITKAEEEADRIRNKANSMLDDVEAKKSAAGRNIAKARRINMSRPKTLTLTLAVDADGICASQTTAGAGSFSLDGALVGQDNEFPNKYIRSTPQRIGITSDGNDSGNTFTITGKGYDSNSRYSDSISEDITGPNATTVDSTNYFTEISDISIDGATVGNITIGPIGEAISQLYPLDWRRCEDVGINVGVTGTINYDIDITLSDIQDADVTPDFLKDASVLAGETSAADLTIDGGARAIRAQVNSGNDAGEIRVHIVQS